MTGRKFTSDLSTRRDRVSLPGSITSGSESTKAIASGELTGREADQLQDNLNYIRHDYSRMTADGRLTQGEINRLERMLDQNSEMIQNKKHNTVRRL